MSTFRWLERCTGFCVSVVEDFDAAKVLAAFGGTPSADVGRVVSFGLGEGGYRLGYAGSGGAVVPAALRNGAVVASRAGVSVEGWPEEGSAHAAIDLVAAVSGVVVDDVVVKSPGLVGRVLPVLPEVAVLSGSTSLQSCAVTQMRW